MWNNNTIEWIDVELTSFCNIACPGCLRQEKKEQVESILNQDSIKFENLKRWITPEESVSYTHLTLPTTPYV